MFLKFIFETKSYLEIFTLLTYRCRLDLHIFHSFISVITNSVNRIPLGRDKHGLVE
jgi:hypothetical protein